MTNLVVVGKSLELFLAPIKNYIKPLFDNCIFIDNLSGCFWNANDKTIVVIFVTNSKLTTLLDEVKKSKCNLYVLSVQGIFAKNLFFDKLSDDDRIATMDQNLFMRQYSHCKFFDLQQLMVERVKQCLTNFIHSDIFQDIIPVDNDLIFLSSFENQNQSILQKSGLVSQTSSDFSEYPHNTSSHGDQLNSNAIVNYVR